MSLLIGIIVGMALLRRGDTSNESIRTHPVTTAPIPEHLMPKDYQLEEAE